MGKFVITLAVCGMLLVCANSGMTQNLTGVLPVGESVTAGSGSIGQSDGQMVIDQMSDRLAIDWQSFSIGRDNSVTFNQPSSSAIALNRVLGSEVSQIQGALNANGRVFLLNPNGVIFSSGSQVNVGGLVASTLELSNADFLDDRFSFSGDSPGSVINQGDITAVDGGTIALIAATIENSGSLTANGGNVLLGAGSKVTLDLGGPVKLEVDEATIDTLIEQGGAIKADGGRVYLTAKSANELTSSVINHTGITEAQTLVSGETGEIYLIGDMNNGHIVVGGTIDASAPNGGDGGFIETSAARVAFVGDFGVTTRSASGNNGTWLIDPYDFTIAASGGDMTGTALSAALGSNNVTIATDTSGGTDNGDIFVNDSVTWGSNLLTLSAWRNIEVNSPLYASGSAGLALEYGQGAAAAGNTAGYAINAPVNLASTGSFSTKLGSDGATDSYTILTALGAEGSTTDTDLQGMVSNLAGRYVLGADIDASATAGWESGAGFMAVGGESSGFTGTFDGLGHTISDLTIYRPNSYYIGLFGYADGAAIRNVGMLGGSMTGNNLVGGLVGGSNGSTVSGSYATGTISGIYYVGGLVGNNQGSGSVTHSYATGNVNGTYYVGGLVGASVDTADISNSYATGNVSAMGTKVGGLVGSNDGYSNISASYATGNVSGYGSVGGLVGINQNSTVLSSYATGDVTIAGTGSYVGGLVGDNDNSSISNAYATGSVSGRNEVGGLVGNNYESSISNSYATGSVSGWTYVGGLAGYNEDSEISNVYATGSVTGFNNQTGTSLGSSQLGGLVGETDYGTINNAYATGKVSGIDDVGGLVGKNYSTSVINSYWDTETSGQTTSAGGTGKTTAEMMTESQLPGFDFTNTGIWWLSEGNTRPFLRSEYSTSISNAHQLQLMALDLGASYTLAADIDMAELTNTSGLWNTAAGFLPVGDYNTKFTGLFDGLGHAITGLIINRDYYIGFFGETSASATISNVGLIDGAVNGNWMIGGLVGVNNGTITNVYNTGNVVSNNPYVGGLVGQNNGTITNSYVTGNVIGGVDYYNLGGLAGENNGTITNSYNTGNVSNANYYVGGLVGTNYGTITNSYNTGSVSGTSHVGGLVGINREGGTITTSYSTGNVAGSGSVGGLVGHNYLATVTDSYWDTQTSGQVASEGSDLSFGKTTAEMKTLATFANWDISAQGGENTIWRIYEGATAPLLRSFFTAAPTLTATAAGKVYDGTTTLPGGSYILETGFDSALVQTDVATYHADSKDVGSRGILMQGIYSNQNDYDLIISSTDTVEITRAGLTVTGVGADNKEYDATNTATLNGTAIVSALGSDTVTVGGTGSGVFADANAGTGKIVTVSGYTLGGTDAGNYLIVQPSGVTANITKAPLTVTADDKTREYGDANPLLTASFSGFKGTDTASVVSGLTLNTAATATSNVGNYTITAADGTATNYTLSFNNGLLTITPAPLTVTADDKIREYGDANPPLTASFSGFKGTDTASVVSGLTLNTAATTSSVAGDYTITAANGTATNYTLSFNNGLLTITPAPTPDSTPTSSPVRRAGEPLSSAIKTIQMLIASPNPDARGEVLRRSGSDPAGFARSNNSGGNQNQNGGIDFVEVADLESLPPTSQNGFGYMRVFVINGGINLPEMASAQTAEDNSDEQ